MAEMKKSVSTTRKITVTLYFFGTDKTEVFEGETGLSILRAFYNGEKTLPYINPETGERRYINFSCVCQIHMKNEKGEPYVPQECEESYCDPKGKPEDKPEDEKPNDEDNPTDQ